MSCRDDAPLSWNQRLGLRLHLSLCGFCRRYLSHVSHLRHRLAKDDLGAGPSMETPEVPLPARARDRIKQGLAHAEANGD
jgi:hypothetical protein